MNKAILIGRLGKDPEVRTTPSGKKVVNFSLATSRKQGSDQVTQWHNISVWDKLAEICEKYLKKGSLVMLSGEIQYRTYEKDDGTKRTVTDIVCFEMEMLGGKPENAQAADVIEDETDDIF